MANLTADRIGEIREGTALRGSAVCATGSSWAKGALLAFNSTGLLVRCADTAGLRFAGEAAEAVGTFAGLSGGTVAGYVTTVLYDHFLSLPIISGTWATGAAVGLDACMIDDNGVTNGATATNDVRIGRCIRRETVLGVDSVVVHLNRNGLSAYAGT